MFFKSVILMLLFSGFVDCAAQVFKNDELEITKLEGHLWVIETTDKTSMYIIEGEKKAMLIDTGTKCSKLDSIVRLITQKPLYVVITHAHPDHAGNIAFFEEIYIHQADTALLSLFGKNYKGKVNYISEGDSFDLGGKVIKVYHTPAHTPGSITLIDKEAGNSFTGDAFGSGQVWLQLKPNASVKTYVNSCIKMETLMDEGIDKVFCGHYPYVKSALTKKYISDMRKLAETLDKGTAPPGEEYPIKVSIGCKKPMIVTMGAASIVYDPENIK